MTLASLKASIRKKGVSFFYLDKQKIGIFVYICKRICTTAEAQ